MQLKKELTFKKAGFIMIPYELGSLREKYADASSKEALYIKKMIEDTIEVLKLCDQNEYYYADMITRNLCRIIELTEKLHVKEMREVQENTVQIEQAEPRLYGWVSKPQLRDIQFQNGEALLRAFYNHYKEPEQVDYMEISRALEAGRKELVNPTMKDYAARINTFSGPKYLGEMFTPQQMGGMDPVLFTYENIELILATFKTRDENGEIVKQRVNIRSALRRLNEFKQYTEQ
jgi:hypothetical protein